MEDKPFLPQPLRVLIAVAVAAALTLLVLLNIDTSPEAQSAAEPVDDSVPSVTVVQLDESDVARASVVPEPDSADDENCLTPYQIETHPMMAADAERWDRVSVTGPTIASYRGLTDVELSSLAEQGDSAAMTVLGAISVMRARELPEADAVSYLLLEDDKTLTHGYGRSQPPEALAHYAEAREWYYKAALHGRVMALANVGNTYLYAGIGAVDLGWITKEELDELSRRDQGALYPSNVYQALPYTVAPELLDGPIGELLEGLLPRTARQHEIVEQLASQFEQDRTAAELPPIAIVESTAPSWEELTAMLCERYRPPEDRQ